MGRSWVRLCFFDFLVFGFFFEGVSWVYLRDILELGSCMDGYGERWMDCLVYRQRRMIESLLCYQSRYIDFDVVLS